MMPANSHGPHPGHRGQAAPADAADRLRRNSRRLTGPRKAILEILRGQLHPVSPKDIFRALGKGHGDLATVYRSLHLLEAMGIVQRFDLGDGVRRFELVRERPGGHHHHLVCRRCAKVVELEDCAVGRLEDCIAERNGFKAVTHRLEFFGICPACQG